MKAATIGENLSIEDLEKNKLIDELFEQRMFLEHDFEGNRERIGEIDRQLISLGVEMLSTAQMLNFVGRENVVPLWEPESTNTIQWTSRKLITTYRGSQYELQIIEGVPISPNSELRDDVEAIEYEAEGITAGITKAIIASANCYIEDTAIGAIADFVNGQLNKGITFLTILHAGAEEIAKSLDTFTVLNRVKGSVTFSFTGHMKYVYVKPYGTTDAKYQGLYYYGNSVSCRTTTVSVVDFMVDGKLETYHVVDANVVDTIQSLYYNDYSQAVANYYTYNYDKRDFKQDYTVRGMNICVLDHSHYYLLPWTTHPSMIY